MASRANRRLCRAAENGDAADIADALLAGADPNALVGDWTPLQWAAYTGHVAAIAALLAAVARVDGANRYGTTPLITAAQNGHTAAIDALLAAGADVHRADRHGDTALHFGSICGRLDVARVLVEAGARADMRTKGGQRPIDVVGAPTRTLGAAAHLRHRVAPPRRLAQVCARTRDKSNEPALRALFASSAPWSRRRPVAIACYGAEWEREA
jgi:ankyrin repeat protein